MVALISGLTYCEDEKNGSGRRVSGDSGKLLGTKGGTFGSIGKSLSFLINFSAPVPGSISCFTLLFSSLIDNLSSSIILLIASSSAFAIAISFSSCKRLISLSLSKSSISARNFAALAAASTKAREIR